MLYRTEGAALFQSPGPPVFCPGTPFGALRAGITIRAGAGTPDSLRPREAVSRTKAAFWVLPQRAGKALLHRRTCIRMRWRNPWDLCYNGGVSGPLHLACLAGGGT